MAVLCDWEIQARCLGSQMVTPFEPELLNPASLDVRLGDELMIEVMDSRELIRVDISDRTKENPYLLLPGEFCLAHTVEEFCLPEDISAQFVLKSSRARAGLNHLLAGWCDPGWGTSGSSVLTLELKNERRHHSIELFPGMKIGQLVFLFMNNIPAKHYGLPGVGHYNNHKTVMPSVV